jgi:hypothetical protein
MSENETGNTIAVVQQVENVKQIHAHRCENCVKNGEETIWMHGDEKGGDVAAHKCPRCGTVEWKKFLVRPVKLPGQQVVQQATSAINLEAILGYLVILVAVCLVVSLIKYLAKAEKPSA